MRNFVNRIRINNIVDNVSIINKTCKLAGIDRISAKSVNIEDDKVWKEIAEDTDLIFQVSGNFGQRTIKQIFSSESQKKIFGHSNLTRMDLFSFTNALLRPCGKSVYNDAINGIARITNVEPIDKEFSSELGYPLFQETQMKFVMDFCGYSFLQADRLRKCIAKGSLITMADGTLKVIEDIKVGDRVISFDGKVFSGQNVKNVWNNGKRWTVEVRCKDGIELKCTQDHRIMTQDGWKMVCDIVKGDCVYTPIEQGCNENEVVYGDFMCVPVVSVEKSGIETVYDIEVENTHNFLANNVLVHNCIAKKMGTREELPVIKKGFLENGKVNLGLSDQKTEEVIEPFLQCILDATRYSFCRIHAYSYSYIGYMCAYLRTYYPLEYLTACLSVWEGKTEKTAEVMNYMKKKKYSIQEARFRHSKSDYMFDKSTKTIYKGMKSIKYMNKICSDQLYELRNNKYNSFTDLLFDVKNLQIDTRQVEILIRLDYFREFGNSKELLVIYKNFLKFKKGEAKTMAINKISDDTILNGIVKRHSKSTEKQYKDLDNRGILNECEDYIKGQNIPDLPIKVKIEDEKEYLGYISMKTENPNDRPKLLILSKRTMISKKGRNQGKPWCVVIDTYSIGSGIQSNFTILYNVYEQEPFNKGDIVYCDKWEKRNGYFYMTKYHLVF